MLMGYKDAKTCGKIFYEFKALDEIMIETSYSVNLDCWLILQFAINCFTCIYLR